MFCPWSAKPMPNLCCCIFQCQWSVALLKDWRPKLTEPVPSTDDDDGGGAVSGLVCTAGVWNKVVMWPPLGSPTPLAFIEGFITWDMIGMLLLMMLLLLGCPRKLEWFCNLAKAKLNLSELGNSKRFELEVGCVAHKLCNRDKPFIEVGEAASWSIGVSGFWSLGLCLDRLFFRHPPPIGTLRRAPPLVQ